MKQAILIMMHKNPEQVIRLVRYFPSDRCVCFVHVDKKADIDIESFQKKLNDVHDKCHIIDTRISGTLACWSLVEISIELLKAAKQYSIDYHYDFKYYRLLSGQDYPIKSFAEYEDFLKNHYPQNFMGVEFYHESKHVRDKFSRWRYSFVREWLNEHCKIGWFREGGYVCVHLLEKIITFIKGTPYTVLKKSGYNVAGGPSWWNLTDRFVDYFLCEIARNVFWISVVRNTATPEESVVQMSYVNSPCYDAKPTYNMTVGNYGRREQIVNGHTYPWRIEDKEELINSDCFFARKFDPMVDCEILDELDKIIYGDKNE